MDEPSPADLVRLRADLRGTGSALLVAGAATVLLATLLDPPGPAWLAWAAGSYLSWTAAFAILTRRRFAAAAAAARPLTAPGGEERLRLQRGRVLWLLVLAGAVAAAAAGAFTALAAGILLAGATTTLVLARLVSRLEAARGGALYVDRRGRLRGWGPLDGRNLWLGPRERTET